MCVCVCCSVITSSGDALCCDCTVGVGGLRHIGTNGLSWDQVVVVKITFVKFKYNNNCVCERLGVGACVYANVVLTRHSYPYTFGKCWVGYAG